MGIYTTFSASFDRNIQKYCDETRECLERENLDEFFISLNKAKREIDELPHPRNEEETVLKAISVIDAYKRIFGVVLESKERINRMANIEKTIIEKIIQERREEYKSVNIKLSLSERSLAGQFSILLIECSRLEGVEQRYEENEKKYCQLEGIIGELNDKIWQLEEKDSYLENLKNML
ncbi:MAG: hypothetical protein AABX30_02415 [Nanoarchaeota archaeon]